MQAFTEDWQLSLDLRPTADRLMAERPIDDRGLSRQLARGDERAFDIIYERYQAAIHRFAWHMSGNHATAEEITQEVFMLLIRRPGNYDPSKGSLGGYLFGIARNLARRSAEQRRADVPFAGDACESVDAYPSATDVSGDGDTLAELTQQELVDALRKAVLSLPAQYREVIVLCDLEQMTQVGAAELLQCSPGTVASRMHRARAMLREKLVQRG